MEVVIILVSIILVVSKYTIDGNQTNSCNDSQDIPYLTIKNGNTLDITKNGKVKVRLFFKQRNTTLNSDSANYASIIEGSQLKHITKDMLQMKEL